MNRISFHHISISSPWNGKTFFFYILNIISIQTQMIGGLCSYIHSYNTYKIQNIRHDIMKILYSQASHYFFSIIIFRETFTHGLTHTHTHSLLL